MSGAVGSKPALILKGWPALAARSSFRTSSSSGMQSTAPFFKYASCSAIVIFVRCSISYGSPSKSGIRCAEPHARRGLHHYSVRISDKAGAVAQFLTDAHKSGSGIAVDSHWLPSHYVGHPLMMNPRRVNSLLNVHAIVNHINNYLQDGVDYGGAARASYGEYELAVLQHDRRRHRGKRPFLGSDCVCLALQQSVGVRHARLGSKIIHLVIQ